MIITIRSKIFQQHNDITYNFNINKYIELKIVVIEKKKREKGE